MRVQKSRKRKRKNEKLPKNLPKFFSYAMAWGWIKRAIAHRFFLEAVTLEESIIADRLISYLCRVRALHPDRSLERLNFGNLIASWKKIVPAPITDPFFPDLQCAADEWRKRRNHVVHGTVKSMPGSVHHDIGTFKEEAERCAKDGQRIAMSICNWCEREKRKAGVARR
jgi:hypothetical protein